MPIQRFAGQDPEVRAALQRHRDAKGITSPAFELSEEGGFRPTADSQRVLGELQRIGGGKPFSLQPAASVELIDGEPIWGSGSGYVEHSNGQIGSVGVVDPIMGNTHTVAHEGAHAVVPTQIMRDQVGGRLNAPVHPLQVPRDNGARVRYVHNVEGSPVVAEEAHAQGVASGIVDRLGLPAYSGWDNDPLTYPLSYTDKAMNSYRSWRDGPFQMTTGPMSPGERTEMERIWRSSIPMAERQFKAGYNLAR